MNAFLCALRVDGAPISKTELFAHLVRLPRHREMDTEVSGSFAAVAFAPCHAMRPLIVSRRGAIGAGDVRLDNRDEVAALSGIAPECACDLEIVLAALDACGADVIAKLLGDFSFVAWNAHAQKVVAARDAFGVKPLFYRRSGPLLLISSRLEPLCGDEKLDPDYVADFMIGLPGPSPRTIWQGALQLEPGAVLVQRGSVTVQSRYWDPRSFKPDATMSEAEAVESFRGLFFDAVARRIDRGDTWAQLSGGVDSSSVVSTAEWLREARGNSGVSGTVTVVDSLGTGDECHYSNLVVRRYGVQNETVRDYWPWRSDHAIAPQATDEPSPLFPFHARDDRMLDLVVHNGGRVLLSGLGSDHYMYGTLSYMADMLARGDIRAGARELFHWSTQTRRSVWHTARVNVFEPVLSNFRPHRALELPRWIDGEFARSQRVLDRIAAVRSPKAKLGSFYATHTAVELARVSNWVLRGPFQDRVEVRYPFLSRPLVEFALRLPIGMKVRPQGRKWILREAMRGILPEEVRTRRQKGGIDARILWALHHERALIDALMTDPILAQLGCVNPTELRRTIEMARQGKWKNTVHVLAVLGLESWLRARTNAWPVAVQSAQSAA